MTQIKLTFSSFFILTFLTANVSMSTPIDKDKLPNLWIVTLDKSGSMYGIINYRNSKKRVYQNIPEALENIDYSRINFNIDKFIFYETGLIRKDSKTTEKPDVLLKQCNSENYNFTDNFIHKLNNEHNQLLSFENKELFINYVLKNGYSFESSNLIEKDYHYYYSFVSLLRPLTIHKVTKDNSHKFFISFNRIYLITLTDDGEIDDQWQIDAKTISRNLDKLEPKLVEKVNSLVFNPFNQSNSQNGGSIDIFYEYKCKDDLPRVYMSEYVTRMSNEKNLIKHKSKFLKIRDVNFDDKKIELSSGIFVPYNLIEIKRVKINSNVIEINKKIAKGDYLVIDGKHLNNFIKNKIQVFAEVQFEYEDQILGKRIKKESVIFDYDNIYSQQYERNQVWIARNQNEIFWIAIASLMLLVVIWSVIYWRRGNSVYLTILDDHRNEFKFKKFAFKKLKASEYNILNYSNGLPTLIDNSFTQSNLVTSSVDHKTNPKFIYLLCNYHIDIVNEYEPVSLKELNNSSVDSIIDSLKKEGMCYKIPFGKEVIFSLDEKYGHELKISKINNNVPNEPFYRAVINETGYTLDGIERYYLVVKKINEISHIGIVKTNHKTILTNLLLLLEHKVKSKEKLDIVIKGIQKTAKKEGIKLEKKILDSEPNTERTYSQLNLEIKKFPRYISLVSNLRGQKSGDKLVNRIKGKHNRLEDKNHFIKMYSPFKNVQNRNFQIKEETVYSPTLNPKQKKFARKNGYHLCWHSDVYFLERTPSNDLDKFLLNYGAEEVLVNDINVKINLKEVKNSKAFIE